MGTQGGGCKGRGCVCRCESVAHGRSDPNCSACGRAQVGAWRDALRSEFAAALDPRGVTFAVEVEPSMCQVGRGRASNGRKQAALAPQTRPVDPLACGGGVGGFSP